MLKKALVALSTALAIAVGIFLVANALGSGLVNPTDRVNRGQFIYALVASLSGLSMIAGVASMSRLPRIGAVLMAGGAVVAAGWHFWMLAIGAPIALLIVVGAVLKLRASTPDAV